MSKAECYRRYADELRAIADESDAVDSQTLRGVADAFDRMANSIDFLTRSKAALQTTN